jgi:hypothetical protein
MEPSNTGRWSWSRKFSLIRAIESYSGAMVTPLGSAEALPVVMKKILELKYCKLHKIRHTNR